MSRSDNFAKIITQVPGAAPFDITKLSDFELFRRYDPQEADLLLRLACEQGFLVNEQVSEALGVIKKLEKFLWRSQQRVLVPSPGRKLGCMEVFHALMHTLVGKKFGFQLAGKPKMCMMAEALASSLDLYFSLRVASVLGVEAAAEITNILAYRGAAQRLNKNLTPDFSCFLKDPMEAYRGLAYFLIERIEKYIRLENESHDEYQSDSLVPLSRFVLDSPYACFADHYDMANFALYVQAKCGFSSTTQDEIQYQECRSILGTSQNISELVLRLV